jgi:hypothetical protein
MAVAGTVVVIDYEDLSEGNQGDPLSHLGLTYYDLNNVFGSFPSGETFGPSPGDEFIVEDAGLFYNDFPGYGSPVNSLTFGIAYVPGENLTIGGLSTVTIDLPAAAEAVSLDLGFYENGPWGGIEFHLDVLDGDTVVGSDSFSISNLGGRDNPAATTMAVSGVTFDRLHLYATWGSDYSMPRAMIDDLTFTLSEPVPVRDTSWGELKRAHR